MTSTAAQPVTHAAEPTAEVLRVARVRNRVGGAAARERLALAATGVLVGGAIGAAALFIHAGPSFVWWRWGFFVLLYALVSRVEFEIGNGAAIPTQLVLVPMLFTLHLGAVPAAVALAYVVRAFLAWPVPRLTAGRLVAQLGPASHALGPVLVLWLAGGLPVRWSAWPIYLCALAAQFAADFVNAAANSAATGVRVRDVARFVVLPYAVDAALSPVALLVAFATTSRPLLVLLSLPLVGLLQHFARERRQRIDSALELSDAYRGTAFLLGDVVEADDAYTGSHSRHVVDLVLAVCDDMGLDAKERRDAEFVALLHDVGKIRIPSEIINKPGALDARERAVIETHTVEGERMLEQVGGVLAHVGRLVRSCHEHWDGNGYPDRLAGEQIPLVARIVCACDAFSAMTTDRPYRTARSRDEALAELQRCAGTQFDPRVVAAITRACA